MDAGISSFSRTSAVTPVPPVSEAALRQDPSPTLRPPAGPPSSAAVSELQINIDAETQALVYQMVDVASGVVVRQTPDETRLKLRAYIDGFAGAHDAAPLVERVA